MSQFTIKVYRSINDEHEYVKYKNGHVKVLRDYGIKKVASKSRSKPSYFFLLEDKSSGEIFGGAAIYIKNTDGVFPVEEALSIVDSNVDNHFPVGTIEIAGLWNAMAIAGLGLTIQMTKVAVAYCMVIGAKKVYVLSAPYTIAMLESFGFRIEIEKGTNGQFIYPGLDVVATLLSLDFSDSSSIKCIEDSGIAELANNKYSYVDITISNNTFKSGYELEIDIRNPKYDFSRSTLSTIDMDLYQSLLIHPELIKEMNWRRFESLLADILETFGYNIELMQGTKDGGIDIIAFDKSDEFGTHKYLLQAKRWKNKVDLDVVKNVLFNHDYYKVTKSCIATTSTFTRGALNLAQLYQWQLELKDYHALQNWIQRAYGLKSR